jgi:hypothetical protein
MIITIFIKLIAKSVVVVMNAIIKAAIKIIDL